MKKLMALQIVVPMYTGWIAYTTFTGAKSGMAGMTDSAGVPQAGGMSKRQQKAEKRGGQKVQYR